MFKIQQKNPDNQCPYKVNFLWTLSGARGNRQ